MSWSRLPPTPAQEASPEIDQNGGQRIEFSARCLARPFDFGPGFGEGAAARMRVHVVRRLGERRGRHVGGDADYAVFDRTVLADYDRKRLLGFEADEFDLLEPHVVLSRQHNSSAARQGRNERSRLGQSALEAAFVGRSARLRFYPGAFFTAERTQFEQRVNVKAQPELGRHPFRRSYEAHK